MKYLVLLLVLVAVAVPATAAGGASGRLPAAEELTAFFAFCEQSVPAENRDHVRLLVIQVAVGAGMFELAEATLAKITSPSKLDYARVWLIDAWVEAGKYKRARAEATRVKGKSQAKWIRTSLLKGQILAGELNEAQQTAVSIYGDKADVKLLETMVIAYAKTGRTRAAARALNKMPAGPSRELAAFWLVPAQARKLEFPAAIKTARMVGTKNRARTYARLARYFQNADRSGAAKAHFEKARHAAAALPKGSMDQIFAYLAVADQQLAVGAVAAARKTVGQAVAIARAIERAGDREDRLAWLVGTLAETGDIKGALAIAKSIENEKPYARAMIEIAHAQALRGDMTGAGKTVESIGDWNEADACGRVAAALGLSGNLKAATAQIKARDEAAFRRRLVVNVLEGLDGLFFTRRYGL